MIAEVEVGGPAPITLPVRFGGEVLEELYELLGVGDGEGAEHDGIEEGVDGGVGSDAEGEGENGDGGEGGAAAHESEGVADVGHEHSRFRQRGRGQSSPGGTRGPASGDWLVVNKGVRLRKRAKKGTRLVRLGGG